MPTVICVKIASRGDLLLAAPTFRRLRAERPGDRILLMVGQSCKDVADHLPFFDEILTVDDGMLLAGGSLSKIQGARNLVGLFRKHGGSPGDEVILFHRDWRYSLLAWVAGLSVRRGFSRGMASCFLTHACAPGEWEHHVCQYLQLAGFTVQASDLKLDGAWKFSDGEEDASLKKASSLGFDGVGDDWVALAHGGGKNVKTRTDLKSWPVNSFRELALKLEGAGKRVVWLGDGEDAHKLGSVATGVNLSGKLSVAETAVVIKKCRLLVANDSLLLHLGEALGIPVLGLFGPTDPRHYRPLAGHSGYLWLQHECSPCHRDGWFPRCIFQHRCLQGLDVETVSNRMGEMLK